MKVLTPNIIARIITATTLLLVFAMTGILFYFLSLRLGDIAKQNQTYNRYNACVLSIPASSRDAIEINRCYDAAQRDTGIQIKRYDNQENR